MKFPKPKRIKNTEFLIWLRKKPCMACYGTPVDVDHIRTRGSGGDDSPDNCMPLCRPCHTLKGKIGVKSFVKMFDLPIDIDGIYPKLKTPWKFPA